MEILDLETAKMIIDFSGGNPDLENLGNIQLQGAVAIHNMIADPDIGLGYLADEVGMGKTYVALGVIALMRYFNPALKVLYICPSRNVQEKWDREYKGFIKYNIISNQYRIRTLEGKPAVPHINCNNVSEIMRMASLGYYADFFVGKDNFSISLSNDTSLDKTDWADKCKSIQDMIPAHHWDGIVNVKADVKQEYAKALNYILPEFDLVMIDEAHNFKHDFNSSDRNRVLSRVLGFSGEDGYYPRVKNALLLSATPYDRDINQLRNQLNLVGKANLLQGINNDQKDLIVKQLKRFMVRRLNELPINGKAHTRNMYRKEHRTSERAVIKLQSDEQKLVTALVQKKVGEMMGSKDSSPSYQIGMLASFESYAQTSKIEPMQFDGDEADKIQNDAQDRHVIAHIVESYKDADLGTTLPHPKMDVVCQALAEELFVKAKKQIVFVRRVKSVSEIKAKLDDHYNIWLKNYIDNQLLAYAEIKQYFDQVFAEYNKYSRNRDSDISEGVFAEGNEGDTEDSQPPKNDTFFAWFFRGKVPDFPVLENKLTTPDAVRTGLTAKNQIVCLLMELNWAKFICHKEGVNLQELIHKHEDKILQVTGKFKRSVLDQDYVDDYTACQLGFIDWYGEYYETQDFAPLISFYNAGGTSQHVDISVENLAKYLQLETFYAVLHEQNLSVKLFPYQESIYQALKKRTDKSDHQDLDRLLLKLDVHCHLVSLCLRTGHGIVDVYLSRLKQGPANLSDESRNSWVQQIINCLHEQATQTGFSTYHELSNLADQLDLIIKTNIPEIYDEPREKRRKIISHRLNPVSPIIGATGDTYAIRSAQARKFRMPGYPLALISTDVFQEGEDLHTFCDSVMHYGLSGSPVSIEQKTGRVDRVNSHAQRRLLSYRNPTLADDDLIQVVFPYVKESIELLQVRQLCRNVNEFIESLHEVGNIQDSAKDIIETDKALEDKSEIPEQILRFLVSPYQADDVTKVSTPDKHKQIAKQQHMSDTITQHVHQLVNACKPNVFNEGLQLSGENSERKLTVRLNSARRVGVIMLVASVENQKYCLSQNSLLECIQQIVWRRLYRIQAEEISNGCYQLYANCEMLVGNAEITQPSDIEHFFARFKESDTLIDLHYSTHSKITEYRKRACNDILKINDIELKVKFTQNDTDAARGIKVTGIGEKLRTHTISIYESGDNCIFIAYAVTAEILSKLGKNKDKKIIEYTWVRNKHIDVVDFFIDEKGNINGRVIHPINSLDWEEFIFSVYILAVEADRLEYIFSQVDNL